MAQKTKRNQHKKQQRALKKRTQRKQKMVRRQSQESVKETPARILRRAREMPIEGAWVQEGWQERGAAVVVLARTNSNENVVFGNYIVDYLCTGVKDTAFATNVSPEAFDNEVIPRLYGGVPPTAIAPDLAHEIVWGAVEYAEALGLRPTSGFRESQRVLGAPDSFARSGVVQFGYQGRPAYIPAPQDNQAAVLTRLIDSVGLGNFYYIPQGDIPDDVIELLQIEQGEDGEVGAPLWTPEGQQVQGSVETGSGLWTPGEQPASEQSEDAPALWTPER